MIKCLLCSRVFINYKALSIHLSKKHKVLGKDYYDQFLKLNKEEGLCNTCKSFTNFINLKNGYYEFCSTKCLSNNLKIKEKKKKTNLKKYGVEYSSQCSDIKEKKKNTCLKKFGVACNLQNQNCLKKREKTFLKNYGVKNPNQCETIKQKKKETNLKKYGVEYILQNSQFKQKFDNTILKKYGVNNISQNKTIKEKKKNTCLKNYGVQYPNQCKIIKKRTKQTNLKKYGVKYVFQNKDIKNKIKQIFLKKYGVENPNQCGVIKEKKKNTCLKKYGVGYVLQSSLIRDKIEFTNLKKYGVRNVSKVESVKQKIKASRFKKHILKVKEVINVCKLNILEPYINANTPIKVECKKCNTVFSTQYVYLYQGGGKCPNCYPKYKSIAETDILNFIESLNLEIISNSRDITKPYELDIYIPSLRIAIEYNGLYWHSEKVRKDKNYHLNKLEMCNEKGINLIQIFEDEWASKQDIVKNRLKQILIVSTAKKIYARQCKIREVLPKIKNEFLDTYHIQGKDNSTTKLGAYYGEELVAVMTFAKGNVAKGSKAKEGIWELNRYCSNSNYRVVGIAGKLLKYFQRNYEWSEIFSYADRRWSSGNLYYKLGFNLKHTTKPGYWYTKGVKRIHRYGFKKDKNDPKDTPEWLLRLEEGYSRVWDCGLLKFVIKNDIGE